MDEAINKRYLVFFHLGESSGKHIGDELAFGWPSVFQIVHSVVISASWAFVNRVGNRAAWALRPNITFDAGPISLMERRDKVAGMFAELSVPIKTPFT
jgi:hypothetical protein